MPGILISAKSYSKARNRGMAMPSERLKRARAVESSNSHYENLDRILTLAIENSLNSLA
jgi:hypothetical protein